MMLEHEINICKCKINAKCLANIEWCNAEAVDNVQCLHVHHDHHHQTADIFNLLTTANSPCTVEIIKAWELVVLTSKSRYMPSALWVL
jgi:hypothetical protein